MSNYLDLLNDDIIDKILVFIADNYENDLNKLSKKVNKLKYKLTPLNIKNPIDIMNPEYTSINYGYISYCLDKYLFNTFDVEGYIIFINICDDYFGDGDRTSYISKKKKNLTYLDIVIEANKAIINSGYCDDYFLEGLNEIPHYKLYNYTGIIAIKDVNYFEFIMCNV